MGSSWTVIFFMAILNSTPVISYLVCVLIKGTERKSAEREIQDSILHVNGL